MRILESVGAIADDAKSKFGYNATAATYSHTVQQPLLESGKTLTLEYTEPLTKVNSVSELQSILCGVALKTERPLSKRKLFLHTIIMSEAANVQLQLGFDGLPPLGLRSFMGLSAGSPRYGSDKVRVFLSSVREGCRR